MQAQQKLCASRALGYDHLPCAGPAGAHRDLGKNEKAEGDAEARCEDASKQESLHEVTSFQNSPLL